MAYQSWSVVFGEQPSAAKWNILGTNDASFNDGTGIAADVITDAKLVYGKVRSRQGGSATNWQTGGTTTYDYNATNTFIQVGSRANNASPTTITFPTAFNQIPVVFAQVTSITGTQCFVEVVNLSTTAFNCQVYDHTGATNNSQTINWMAIGE